MVPLIGGGMGLGVTVIPFLIFFIFFIRYLTKAKNYTFKSFNIPVLWTRVLILGIIISFFFTANITLYVLAMTIADTSDLFCILCGVPIGVNFLNIIVSIILLANCSKATSYLRGVGRREDVDVEEYDDEEA
ncbi:MAG: hypothetical protein MJ233_01175 [Mycoplasmoidaceae bacterium]|nr:hypothetical protein [Mycoplasmoidaceae bacterium]